MKPERLITTIYTDILAVNDGSDAETLRIVRDLDALYTDEPIPAPPPFQALVAATSTRATPYFAASDAGAEPTIGPSASDAIPIRSRRDWFRQGIAFAGAAVAFMLVAGILVLLFRESDEPTTTGAQPAASPTVTTESALPTTSNPGQIAFTSIRDGNPEIYLVNADGSGLTRLTDNPTADQDPAWSPDGAQIAFSSDRDGEWRLYIMTADGTDVRRVTEEGRGQVFPVWSPDGEWIAFIGTTDDGLMDIFIVHPDGSDLRRLTDWKGIDTDPAWSPTSQQIVYRSSNGPGEMDDIFVVNIDGSGRANLTNDIIPQREPQWSRDGIRIAFSHASHVVDMGQGATGFYDTIAFFEPTSQNGVPFQTTIVIGSTPRWSPDGRYLAYHRPASEPGPNATAAQTLHILQTDGLETGRIPGIDGTGLTYEWSPDGQSIAVAVSSIASDGNAGNERNLLLAKLDGSTPVLLAEQLDHMTRPAWRPTP